MKELWEHWLLDAEKNQLLQDQSSRNAGKVADREQQLRRGCLALLDWTADGGCPHIMIFEKNKPTH